MQPASSIHLKRTGKTFNTLAEMNVLVLDLRIGSIKVACVELSRIVYVL